MQFKPDGHPTVSPSIIVPGAAKVVEFLERVFDGRVIDRYDNPDGTIGHIEVKIGESHIYLGDPFEGWTATAYLWIYVPDVDAAYARALEHGATSIAAPADQFYGVRVARLVDSFGNRWSIGQQIEEVSAEAAKERYEKMT